MVLLYNYDGILETMYHLLWSKEFDEKMNHFRFFLPHTILFKNNMPITWYFSSKSGEVLRKKPQNINNEFIIQEFSRAKSKSLIAAMYFYEVNEDLTYCKQFHLLDKVDKDKTISRRVMIEYVSYEGLRDFLNNQSKSPFGILQKFIDPYGPKNFIIEALWTPKMTLFSKKVNVNNLFYEKLELIEKAATFDGNDIYSEVIQIKGPEISLSLRESMTQIVRHIATVSFDHIAIKRMVCYLKIDPEQKVWLLWCGSCRAEREKLEFSKTPNKKVVKTVVKIHHKPLALGTLIKNPYKHKRIYSLSLRTPAEISKNEVCPNCHGVFVKSEMVMCDYLTIIRKFKLLGENENCLSFARKTEENRNDPPDSDRPYDKKTPRDHKKVRIPNLINKLHPELSYSEYQTLSKDSIFLQNLIEICLDCYTDLTKNLKVSGPDPEVLYKISHSELNPIAEQEKRRILEMKESSKRYEIEKKRNPSILFLQRIKPGNDALENEVNNALKLMLDRGNNINNISTKELKHRPASSISWISSHTKSTMTNSFKKSYHSKNPSFF